MKASNLAIYLGAGAVFTYVGLNFCGGEARAALVWVPLIVGLTFTALGFAEAMKQHKAEAGEKK